MATAAAAAAAAEGAVKRTLLVGSPDGLPWRLQPAVATESEPESDTESEEESDPAPGDTEPEAHDEDEGALTPVLKTPNALE